MIDDKAVKERLDVIDGRIKDALSILSLLKELNELRVKEVLYERVTELQDRSD